MYHILTFENGQPAILYLENETAYLYVITKGRIVGKGPLFNDVKSDLQIFGANPYYIYYISTDNRIKIYTTMGQLISEIINFSLTDKTTNTSITHIYPLFHKKEFLIFYLQKNTENNYHSLHLLTASYSKSQKLLENLSDSSVMGITLIDNIIHIGLRQKNNYSLHYLDESQKLIKVSTYDETQSATIETLKKQIVNKDNEITAKNKEISKLTSTQKYITEQYNDLAEYTGKLQEELRNSRYNL